MIFNSISLAVLLTGRMKKNSGNSYLIALAIYDIGVLVLNFGVGVARAQIPTVNEYFQQHEWLCRLHAVVMDLVKMLSIWMIVSFSVERCLSVFLPLKAHLFSSVRRSQVVILVVSFIILVFSCHKIFITGFEKNSVFGYSACITTRLKMPRIVLVNVALGTWTPLCVTVVTNVVLVIKVKTTGRLRRRVFGRKCHSNARDSAATRTLLAVSLAYIILVLPLGVTQSVEMGQNIGSPLPGDPGYLTTKQRKYLLKLIRETCFCLYQLNFAINFLLYLASNSTFRQQLLALVRGKQVTRQRYFHHLASSLKQHQRITSMKELYRCSSSSTTVTTGATSSMKESCSSRKLSEWNQCWCYQAGRCAANFC